MSESRADIELLISELQSDLAALSELEETNKRAQTRLEAGADDELDFAVLGYTLHNIYNLVENSFYRIARHFENNLNQESWHKDLLYRMTLSIEGIRPAIIDRATADELDELRSFRHVFRNMYRKRLDPQKIRILQESLPSALAGYTRSITAFIETLRLV